MAFGNWILALTWGEDLNNSWDEYRVFDTYEHAETQYKKALESEELCIASITLIMKSTDYIGVMG